MIKSLVCVVLASVVAGCSTINGPSDSTPDTHFQELVTARASWNVTGSRNYDAIVRQMCFCRRGGQEVRIVVRNSALVSATVVATNQPLPADESRGFLSIEQMFDQIEAAIATRVHELRVEFDPVYGYPKRYWIDVSERMADEEHGFEVFSYVAK